MDWQWQRLTPEAERPNPADAADGPAGYDDHLYFGWVLRLRYLHRSLTTTPCSIGLVRCTARFA